MTDLLKNTYNDFESLRGRRLATILLVIFLVFIPVGILIGIFTDSGLNGDEPIDTPVNGNVGKNLVQEYKGKITYLDPAFYPVDGISYVLVDRDGEEIILLKSTEEILTVAEGLTATVSGRVKKTKDGSEEYLLVSEVTISNVSN